MLAVVFFAKLYIKMRNRVIITKIQQVKLFKIQSDASFARLQVQVA